MDQDFPPLVVTTQSQDSSATDSGSLVRYDQEGLTNYFHSLLSKELDTVRKETANAIEQANAKTDNALIAMGKQLAAQERHLSTSVLQTRVDPINRAYDSIMTRVRQLETLQREYKEVHTTLVAED